LAAGLYWKRANTQGALFAVGGGLGTWVLLELLKPETVWPPQLLGLFAACAGMLLGSLLPHVLGRPSPAPAAHESSHRRTA